MVKDEQAMKRLSFNCTQKGLPEAVAAINQWEDIKPTLEILQLSKVTLTRY